MVSGAATLSGFASNIYFPAIPAVSTDLSVSTELINLTITCYMIFQGLSPTLWSALSDVKGRRITYLSTLAVFVGACIGLALTRHYAQLVVLRCLQSTGSASTIAIGAGVVGDITTREDRGGYMGFFQAGLLLPVAIGPVLGGALAGTLGWKSIFWFLAIYGAIFFVVLLLALPETLRSLVGKGSLPVTGIAKSPLASLQRRRHDVEKEVILSTEQPTSSPSKKIDLLGPVRILTSKSAIFAILFVAAHYTTWQMVLTATSTLFTQAYHLTETRTGLIFLANGIGSIIGTASTGKILDYDFRHLQRQSEASGTEVPLESARLRTVFIWSALQCASILVFGWTIDKRAHISAPIIGMFVLGWAAISIQSVVSTFLVDLYPKQSASATAALNLVRCLVGAGGTAVVGPLIARIGTGWTFTILAVLMLASSGLVVAQMVCGRRWRREVKARQNDK